MSESVRGLRSVPTADLTALLRALHRGTLPCPLLPASIACVGLQHRQEDLLGALRGLELRAVVAVLVCVIAERGDHAP